MTQPSIAYFIFVRGMLQFGFLAAAIYVLLNVAMDGTFLSVRWAIVIGFPLIGLLWGFFMWMVDRRKSLVDK